MSFNTTTVQKEESVRVGSAAFLVSSDSGANFSNFGVMTGIASSEEIAFLDQRPDNGTTPTVLDGIASQTATVTGNLMEIDPSNRNLLRGGIDTFATTSTTPISGGSVVVASGAWEYDVPVSLDIPVLTVAALTVTSVTGLVDSTLAVGDYQIVMNGGNVSIVLFDTATITTEAQSITLVVSYTPYGERTLSTGGKSAISRRWIRMINGTQANATATDKAENAALTVGDSCVRAWIIDFYYGKVNVGDAITFPSKDDTAPAVLIPLSMIFEEDASRAAGDQLKKETFRVYTMAAWETFRNSF